MCRTCRQGGVNESSARAEVNAVAQYVLQRTGGSPPTFVAFTGDVAETAMPAQYERARHWIGYLFECLGLGDLPASNLLYVPGHHDVNLSLATAARVSLRRGSASTTPVEGSTTSGLDSVRLCPYP